MTNKWQVDIDSKTRKSRRNIDYRRYHLTGEKVEKVTEVKSVASEDNLEMSDNEKEISLKVAASAGTPTLDNKDRLRLHLDSLADDIEDFIDENPIKDIEDSTSELDLVIKRVEEMRSQYRSKYKELAVLRLSPEEEEAFGRRVMLMKDYILYGKEARRRIRKAEESGKHDERQIKSKAFSFLLKEANRVLKDLDDEFQVDIETLDEKELRRRNTELASVERKVENLASKFPEILSYSSSTDKDDEEIERFKKKYEDLLKSTNKYVSEIKKQMEDSELDKEEKFKESNLNIRLSKFKGYSSPIDIYTFQSEFEKIYARDYPKRILPDLLKNNFLAETALSLVKSVDNIDEIWVRLKRAFGDPKVMLGRKFEEINKIGVLWKTKDPEKLIDSLQKVVNVMKDLIALSEKHRIENDLYHGDGLERVLKLLGESRTTRWISSICDEELTNKQKWENLLVFLEKETKVLQQKMVLFKKDDAAKEKGKDPKQNDRNFSHHNKLRDEKDGAAKDPLICSICDQKGHVATMGPNFSKIVQYFTCKKFVDMTAAQRFAAVKSKGLCYQCLFPGADVYKGKHKDGKCQRDFACKHENHSKFKRKIHVLLCEEHKDNEDNKRLLKEYKTRCMKMVELPSFSKEIKLSFHTGDYHSTESSSKSDGSIIGTSRGCFTEKVESEKAIYQLQTVMINGECFTIFFDSGCGDFVSRYKAIPRLGARATQECEGPIQLGGVGGIVAESTYGIYTVKLPLFNGDEAKFTGVCLEEITGEFPSYPIRGAVEKDIVEAYTEAGGDPNELPKLPGYVGGEIDLMIGIKYLRYHPEQIFQMPSGLTIYKSMFENAGGGTGVIGGPHAVFTQIEKQFYLNSNHLKTFLFYQKSLYNMGYQVNPDVRLLGFKDFSDLTDKSAEINQPEAYLSRNERRFEEVEKAGSEITYRCIRCRSCKSCRNCEQIEAVSIKEEVEQDLIEKSVVVDLKTRSSIAKLPLIHDPVSRLAPNKHRALKVYTQQLRKLDRNPGDKEDVLKSEKKLQTLGFVEYVRNLPEDQQEMLKNSKVQNFIPWRAVWKEDSITTPCRVVFDASQPTDSGYSLNDIIAKGRNNMNKLQEIVIRWTSHSIGFHSDIQKMYNCVKLREEHWCMQRYIWQEDLDPTKIPEEKVIKTLIYGVKSSGNLAERSIRETATLSKQEYPEIDEIVHKDIYVDDCLSGAPTEKQAHSKADDLEVVLNRGGFSLKGVAFSRKKPPESMSQDGKSIIVAGIRWYTEEDTISLNLKDMIFSKKQRGKRPKTEAVNVIPQKLTRRHCVAKVAEVFDILGNFTPLIAEMKLDLHELIQRKLNWDDVIPDNLRYVWQSHFSMILEMRNVRYNRAVVPIDAADLNVDTLDFGDASKYLLCVAIYARFRRQNGEYSCQLVLARSRLIPDTMSQPRAELYAAVVNTHSGEIVKRAFSKIHRSSLKLTDSQIVLHWINNEEKPLKLWVRNRVLEIRRFTKREDWRYVETKNMIADIGTRRGSRIEDVDKGSIWINGFNWMRKAPESFPIKSADDISLLQEEIQEMKKEVPHIHDKEAVLMTRSLVTSRKVPDEVTERYRFSNYLIDPNFRSFHMVIRIAALVIKFINILREKVKKKDRRKSSVQQSSLLNNEDIAAAEKYYFTMATLEIKHFYKKEYYSKFSKEVDGILKYSGRILPTDKVEVIGPMTKAMKDLTSTTFCVPVIDKHSPIAYSIISDFHWNDKVVKHRGIETTLRQILSYAYINGGRELLKKVKKSCERCRYLAKKTIDVMMGPVSHHNITIAPAFYASQVDLAGPFKSYSNVNKRATVKIWMTIFCCAATATTCIKVMEDYSSTSFIQAFVRFSCEVGYPKLLLVDSGSQLLSSCNNVKLNFQDVQNKLHRDVAVESEVVPVGGHNMNGRVERKIREIRKSLEINVKNERLSILQWETLCAEIANRINDLPLALGNIKSYESMDLITPNRLRLGRNNNRSPCDSLTIANNPLKILEENKRIFNTWFEYWLMDHVPKLMTQPKWFKMEEHIKEGDIVLFLKHDSTLSSTYQYGMITSAESGKDGVVRKARVKYRNHQEDFDRETYRSIRQLVLIHRLDELNIEQELAEMSRIANTRYRANSSNEMRS